MDVICVIRRRFFSRRTGYHDIGFFFLHVIVKAFFGGFGIREIIVRVVGLYPVCNDEYAVTSV